MPALSLQLVLASLAVVAASPLDKCAIKEDTDCAGQDISQGDGDSAADCCDKCAQVQGCKAFTFQGAWKKCFFKSGCDNPSSHPGNTVGTIGAPSPPPSPFNPNVPAAPGKPMGPMFPIRGVAYGALPYSPLSTKGGMSEDMLQQGYEMQWGAKGRDDLGMMSTMGANAVRLYHSLGDGSTAPHGGFLDRASELGLRVLPGFHTYMSCPDDDCYDSWKAASLQSFDLGFAKDGSWHKAVSALILLNEPDFTPCDGDYCRVKKALSALEGVLAAEKEKGLDTSATLPMLTVTWSFGMHTSIDGKVRGPGIFGFQDMVAGVAKPDLAHYTPRDHAGLQEAFDKRWIHGVNTQAPWSYVQSAIGNQYSQFLPKKWFIGEYGANGQSQTVIESDLKAMNDHGSNDAGFAGVNFFQYQTAYEKGGSEMNFGLFSLGDQLVGNTGAVPEEYPVYCLNTDLPWFTKNGHPEMSHRADAAAKGWGGSTNGRGRCTDAATEIMV